MRVEDIQEAKADLESEIYHAVSKLLNEFEAKTGMTPDDVLIYMERRSIIGRPENHILAAVKTVITI